MLHNPKNKREHSPPDIRPNMSDLRIVLLGTSIAENHRVVNLILNKEAFGRKAPSSAVEEFSERVEGRNITVISTSHLLNPELKLQAILQKALALSSPEPHVFILVLQHRDFSEKQRGRIPSVLSCFGEQAMKHTIILTTDDEPCEAELRSAQENEFIQDISTECGGGHLQLQNTQHYPFIKRIDEMISGQQSSSLESRAADSDGHESRKGESASQEYDKSDLRIVLLGKNVSENSRVRNSILGIDVNESIQFTSLKQHNMLKISGMVKNRHVMVINTLHLLNPNTTDHQISQSVRECAEMSDPGPHVFILVLQYKDFTEEDTRRVKHVLNTFSEEAINHTIIIMTNEQVHSSHINTAISQLTNACGGRHLLHEEGKPDWPTEIFNRVDMMLKDTKEYYVTCEVYEEAKELSEEEEQSRYLHSSRSDEVNKHLSYHNDDGNPKQSKRSEETLVDVREWIRTKLPENISGKQKLNLVLCGSDGSLKVSASKLLRGKPIATSHQRSRAEFFKKEEKVHGHQISLLELPALSRLSEEEVMRQTLRCVCLCDPGVHAFLIIIPVGHLTDEDKQEVEKVLNIFDTKQHFIVIFIIDGTIKSPVRDFIKSSPECQKLISHCGGLYCVMGLKEHANSRQIPELLEYIEKMKTKAYSPQMYVKAQKNRGRREAEEKYEEEMKRLENRIKELQEKAQSEGAECSGDLQCLRIVLIGRTGNGKSATGNTILGIEKFLSQLSMDSVTNVCEKGVGEVDGRSVAVVDTPGLFDTTLTNDQMLEEIVKCVSLSAPGPHVFVIVLRLGRFTKEETDTVDLIKKIFGPKAAQFSIVLFTRGDELKGQPIENFVEKGRNAELKKLIRDCGNRFLAFNNNENQDKTQVIELLKMIEEVKANNQGGYFTNSMFEEAEMSIKKKMEEIMKEREREMQKHREELQAKYEMEMKRLEEEKQRAEEEKRKMENQLKVKEEKVKKEFEEKEKTDQKKRETENLKRLEEEKQQRAEYHQRIEEMMREIESQRSQYEQQQKEREEEDRKREEKYRQDQDKMRNEQERIIAELLMRQEETKMRDLEKKRRNEEEEEEERQRWERRIKEAENEKKKTQEEIKRQQREWEDEKKRQMREREEEERKKEKYRQDQEKMRNENESAMADLKKKHEEETRMRESEERKRIEQEEKERQEWERKLKEADNERKVIQEEIKRQQREWEDEMKRRLGQREEEERKRKEKHEEQLREKQEELEKMRKRFKREREEERQKMEEERQKQRREREEKEREYEEKRLDTKRHYERLERERKEEWERRKQEDEERREEERKRWKKMIEDLKREQEEEKDRREAEEKERQKREEKERDEMRQKHEEEIKQMKKKHEDEARKQAEESNDFRERKEQHVQELQQMLEEHQKQKELLEKLYQYFKDEKSEEVKELKRKIEDLNKKWCRLM